MAKEEEEIEGFKKYLQLHYWILYIFIFFIFLHPVISRYFGKEELDATFESSRPYNAQYFAYLFSDENSQGNFKAISDIYVYYEHDGEGKVKTVQLERSYTPDGVIEFEDCYIFERNSRFTCKDSSGKEWFLEFKQEKVK